MAKIKIVHIHAGESNIEKYFEVKEQENDMSLLDLIDGYVESVTLSVDDSPVSLLIDEDGKFKDLLTSGALVGFNHNISPVPTIDYILGDIVIAGADIRSGEFISLSEKQIEELKSKIITENGVNAIRFFL